ncbi:hypothetical protein BaRGS_00012760 [Batillaria attramentaria]|uniref:Uncharacterized protein n=1 Tax=Batillaria attramentaria TaxID=370345 RepID=A0ABD0LAA2_9CAEN
MVIVKADKWPHGDCQQLVNALQSQYYSKDGYCESRQVATRCNFVAAFWPFSRPLTSRARETGIGIHCLPHDGHFPPIPCHRLDGAAVLCTCTLFYSWG